MMEKSELWELKQQFLVYLETERGRSDKTIENYGRYVSRFLTHSAAQVPKDITESVVREFRTWLNHQDAHPTPHGAVSGPLKKKTQNYYLIALRAFLKYLRKRGITSLEPERIKLAQADDRTVDFVTDTELACLLQAPDAAHECGLRDQAILQLLFSTGLRVSELCALDADVDLRHDKISVRGKGKHMRVVPLSREAREAVNAWLTVRRDMDKALFINIGKHKARSGTLRLTPRSVQRLIKHHAEQAGITRKVTPHVIRHTFATDLVGNGTDLRSVQTLLGHAHISTTQMYTHGTDTQVRRAHKKRPGKHNA